MSNEREIVREITWGQRFHLATYARQQSQARGESLRICCHVYMKDSRTVIYPLELAGVEATGSDIPDAMSNVIPMIRDAIKAGEPWREPADAQIYESIAFVDVGV